MTATAQNGYVAIARRALDVEDYVDLARRHVSWIVGPTFAGIVIATVTAFLLPNTYVSTAEMQITPAQISQSIVATTINQQLTERIQQMENEILSRTSLSGLIQDPRLDLYKSERQSKPLEDVIEEMRSKDIKIQIVSLAGDERRRASAFTVSFSYADRLKAQQTVQALITKFNDANQTSQRTQQDVVKSFVSDSLAEAKANLDKLDEELTKFRIENQGKLPEQSQLNMAQLAALQGQANGINDALNRLAQNKIQLETHLQTLKSQQDLLTVFDKDMQAAADSPVASQQVKRQNERLVSLERVIQDMESQLNQLHLVYKSNYPDIRDTENRLGVIRKERDDLKALQEAEETSQKDAKDAESTALAAQQKARADASKKATNYAMARSTSELQGQIDATEAQLQSLELERANRTKEQQQAEKAITSYQDRLTATSGIEAKYADLVRDERSAAEKYQVLQGKQSLSDQNNELLQRKAGENLDVLDPPSLPLNPAKPNRWLIVGAGTGIAFVLGLALAGVQEAKDTSLKNLKDVRAYTNLPVLSSIPLLENTMVVRRKRRMTYLIWSACVIIGGIAVASALYYHYTYAV
jgi:succinoglycan biosynthesis transport protein ExoP